MDESEREQALLTVLTTEHYALQTSRAGTIAEATGRATIFLSVLSAALIGLGFVASNDKLVRPYLAAVLPTLVILGVLTFLRLVETTVENSLDLLRIQRIRRVPPSARRRARVLRRRGGRRRHEHGVEPGRHASGAVRVPAGPSRARRRGRRRSERARHRPGGLDRRSGECDVLVGVLVAVVRVRCAVVYMLRASAARIADGARRCGLGRSPVVGWATPPPRDPSARHYPVDQPGRRPVT